LVDFLLFNPFLLEGVLPCSLILKNSKSIGLRLMKFSDFFLIHIALPSPTGLFLLPEFSGTVPE